MKKNKYIVLFIFLILSASTYTATAQESNSYEKDLKYLLEINGEQTSYQKSIKAMIVELKKYESNVPDTYWVRAEVEFVDDLMNS